MMVRRHGEGYHFVGDTDTGLTMRWGNTMQSNPVCAPWPELADISISNYCTKGCEFCYKDSTEKGRIMSAEEYDFVLESLTSGRWGSVFQVALGGGEPLENPDFPRIIDLTRKRGIVPNFTTNGIHLEKAVAEQIAEKVGSVAVSVNSCADLQPDKIQILTDAGIRTNLHFVLDSNSIHEAIDILEGRYNDVLQHLNGVVFLTYKPKGRAAPGKCLKPGDNLTKFVSLTDNNKCCAHIGFDACFVPVLMRFTKTNVDYIDSCECGFFSVYIDENLNVKPCSFANNDKYTYSLKKYSFEEIWERKYQKYRNEILANSCESECPNKEHCRGKCSYFDELSFCYEKASSKAF